ncbi:SusC/RagA family TonB-linked outer membrane protein [Hydrotalea flava]|uniref:SusC/RagA family TonB-linked outer membrane protein n=1 Tax=Hydrotalea flava TaxID=714549 RepID=UPI000A688369|nr:TonB-dependent receptor [Hydrotalea flava]
MRKLLLLLVCALLTIGQLWAQSRTIKGTILDENGKPIERASIMVRGTRIGTSTEADGTYTLNVPQNAKYLIISALNFGRKEISIEGKTEVDVKLEALDSRLDEVVVVAYGTQKKNTLTGSQASVKGGEIENKPFTSVDKALQGAVAGLQSAAASGAPGSSQAIRIRGIGSISASSDPLWVIDGIPVNIGDASRLTTTSNLLSTLNPDDIEDITVLKDAASSSIYGSRAANGVILVTTKKGRPGATRFKFDAEAGQNSIAYKNSAYQPLTADQYGTITKEGLINSGQATPTNVDAIYNANFLSVFTYPSPVNTDWLSAVTRTGGQQQYNLSASGGNEKTTFFLSGGMFKQDGTTIASDFTRLNGNARIENKATNKLTLGFTLNGGVTDQNTPLSGGAFGNPVLSAFFLLPTLSPYKPDGTLNYLTGDFPNASVYNTVAVAALDKRNLHGLSLRGAAYAEYKILDNLRFKTQYGVDYNTLEENQYNNPFYGDGQSSGGRAFAYYTRYMNWDWVNTLDFKQSLLRSGDLNLNLKVGYESQLSKGYFVSVQNSNFPPTTILTVPAIGATPKTASQTASDYSFVGAFSSADLNYKERYIITGSFRNDGSSRFGLNKRYGNFWSIGGRWNIDREKFMQNIKFINQLVLRSSYGTNGNAGIGNYDALPLYGYGSNYIGNPGSAPSQAGNIDLTWEINKPFNVGMDVTILKNRVSFTIEYYKRNTTSLLLAAPVPPSTGFTSVTKNIGAMENKGIEFTLNVVPVQTRDFRWNLNFNIAANQNKITALVDNRDILSGVNIRRVGYDFQTYYARVYAGVDPANGDPLWYTDATRKTTTNNYGSALRIPYQTASPKVFGGFGNSFKYKNFSLSANFYYNFGNYLRDTWGSYYNGAGFGGGFNKVKRIMNRWTTPGQITDIPKYVYGGNKSAQSFSTFYLFKGDFIRLRDIELGYDLPKSLLSKYHIGMMRFYVRGTNLWTWVADSNMPFDPEQGVSSQTNLEVFIPKTVTAGVNISF